MGNFIFMAFICACVLYAVCFVSQKFKTLEKPAREVILADEDDDSEDDDDY